MGEFQDKHILISGASSGIGMATAIKFANMGAIVIATSKDEKKATTIMEKLQKISPDSFWIGADILEKEEIENIFKIITEQSISLFSAFNNSATGSSSDFLHNISPIDWETTINGTLNSIFHFMHHELKNMVNNNGGTIINNSSVDGLRGFPFDPAYSAAKHGVIGLTKSTALQYANNNTNIRINAIAPGWVDTPSIQKLIEDQQMSSKQIISQQPIGRLGKPEEIANLVVWLASKEASFMTGSVIPIDGGYTA